MDNTLVAICVAFAAAFVFVAAVVIIVQACRNRRRRMMTDGEFDHLPRE